MSMANDWPEGVLLPVADTLEGAMPSSFGSTVLSRSSLVFDPESELLVEMDCRWPKARRYEKRTRVSQCDESPTSYADDHLAKPLVLAHGNNSDPVQASESGEPPLVFRPSGSRGDGVSCLVEKVTLALCKMEPRAGELVSKQLGRNLVVLIGELVDGDPEVPIVRLVPMDSQIWRQVAGWSGMQIGIDHRHALISG